jgi:hypothetical protein
MDEYEKSAEYRAFAAECLRLAQTAVDPADKAFLLEMAVGWHVLAAFLEQVMGCPEPPPDLKQQPEPSGLPAGRKNTTRR